MEHFVTHPQIPLSQDAALVVALAGTAMPFAHSREDEAERWLRTLRLHGTVGATLQALGVGESPLMNDPEAGPGHDTPPLGPAVLDRVTERACEIAAERNGEAVCTSDLLFAVMDAYGPLFEHTLYLRGTSREELTERLSGEGALSHGGS
jgi:hypothetical protein